MKSGHKKMNRLIFLTGPPRTGKTTTLLKVAKKLKSQGHKLGGMISREIRENGIRVGFEIQDYESGEKGWLAHIRQHVGPRISKYRVNLAQFNSIGVTAILNALQKADIVLIDEIGPMELFSEPFKDAVNQTINSTKAVLGTIHYSAQDPLVKQIKSRNDADIIDIVQQNRYKLHSLIAEKVVTFIKTIDSRTHTSLNK
ncbi:MAG: NTPase [Candidatus Bathyarchaeia archaeon]